MNDYSPTNVGRRVARCPLQLAVVDGLPDLPMGAELYYEAADPYAVALVFPGSAPDDWIVWGFSRSLLAAGLIWPSGDGDVHVAPSGDRLVSITLSSPSGRVVLLAARAVVADFLRATYLLVPAGAESVEADLDVALNDLLNHWGD